MQDRESLEAQLDTARRVLAILEEQAAGYTTLTVPAHLRVEVETQRDKVASLGARLAQLAGQATAIPDNLPRRHDIFVGRAGEIRRCLEALDPEERGWGVTIDGIGGIGKTALALEVAHRARDQAWFDAYLFASAKTTWLTPDGVHAETLALTSLDAFSREFALGLGARDVAEIPDATDRRRALLDALRGRRALLIWDNLETLNQGERLAIAEFLRRLPGANKAIVTSRRRTGESALTIRLNRLAEGEALALIDELGRRRPRVGAEVRRVGTGPCRRLYEAAGGNPLAIHWTLGLVAQKGYSLPAALERLENAARSGDLYAFLFADAARDLAEVDRKVLTALAYFRTPAGPAALAEAAALAATQVEVALERLVGLSLVDDLAGGRYGLHPLTRTYVRATLDEEGEGAPGGVTLAPEARSTTLRYWLDYAQKYGGYHQDAYRTFDRLETEWPNLEAAASALWEQAGLPGPLRDRQAARMLDDLANALRSFFWFQGYWEERVRLGGWAYEATKALGNWQNAGWRAYDVAWIHFYRAETEQAEAWAGRCAEAWERGGDRRERAVVSRLRGLIAQQRGDLDEAQRLGAEALAAFRDLGNDRDVSTALDDLGSVARQRKDYKRAEAFYREALALAEKAANKEPQASYCGSLGLLALARGRPAEARRWYERELALAREVGLQELIAEAQAGLARVLEAEGRPAEALPLTQEALRIQERLRHGDLAETRDLVARLREATQNPADRTP